MSISIETAASILARGRDPEKFLERQRDKARAFWASPAGAKRRRELKLHPPRLGTGKKRPNKPQ